MSNQLQVIQPILIPESECNFKLIEMPEGYRGFLHCLDFVIETNYQVIDSKIALLLGISPEYCTKYIGGEQNYTKFKVWGVHGIYGVLDCITIDQFRILCNKVRNPRADKYKPKLFELIFNQVLPLFNQTIKHDDFKKEIDMNIIATSQPLTMSSLEIAELCDKEHRNVMRDIKNMLEQLEMGALSFEHTYINPQNGQQYKCYNLNKELSLTLVAGYNVKLRHKIILRWQELENNPANALPNFADPAEAAIAWANQYKEKQALENKLEEAKPLIGFAETAQKATKGILVRDLAYLAQNDGIKIGEKRLWAWFRTMGFIHQRSTRPMQEFVERGYFVMQPTFVHHNSGMQEHMTTKITGEGQIYFLNKLKNFFNIKGNHEQNNPATV